MPANSGNWLIPGRELLILKGLHPASDTFVQFDKYHGDKRKLPAGQYHNIPAESGFPNRLPVESSASPIQYNIEPVNRFLADRLLPILFSVK